MSRLLTFVWLVAAALAATAFGDEVDEDDTPSLVITPCLDGTEGTCGACSTTQRFPLTDPGMCALVDDHVGFWDFKHHAASCSATDKTFTFTRHKYKYELDSIDTPIVDTTEDCQRGVTMTASLGCIPRHIYAKLTLLDTDVSVGLGGVSADLKARPTLTMCDTDKKECPLDCSMWSTSLEVPEGAGPNTCIDSLASDIEHYSFKLKMGLSGKTPTAALQVWTGRACKGTPVLSIDTVELTKAGVCYYVGTEYWNVSCPSTEPAPPAPAPAPPIESTPSFVGGHLLLTGCKGKTADNVTCTECAESPVRLPLGTCQRFRNKHVTGQQIGFVNATCNETDNTLTLRHYGDEDCHYLMYATHHPVGCATRYIMAKITAMVENNHFGHPTYIKPVVAFCETSTEECPSDCNTYTVKFSARSRFSDEDEVYTCIYAEPYLLRVQTAVNAASLTAEVNFTLWEQQDGNFECSDSVQPLTTLQIEVPLRTLDTTGVCVTAHKRHMETTCVGTTTPPPPPEATPLGGNGSDGNNSDSGAPCGALVVFGLATILVTALLLH